MSSLTRALLVFGVCYAQIMTERLHKTIVAWFGADD
jgi:Na+/H+ antiporter NhaD/arsenite permease-like protein